MWMEIAFGLLLAGVATVAVLQYRSFGKSNTQQNPIDKMFNGDVAQHISGILTVTGVSKRGVVDKEGKLFCAISGTIIGPEISPTQVYRQFIFQETDSWPQIGAELPVTYRPGKVDASWRLS